MKILVFGKDGQLGRAFQDLILQSPVGKSHSVRFVGRNECDLAKPIDIENLLLDFSPALIVNAAAYTAVDKAELEPDLAFAINARAPEIMAHYAASHGASLIHFSTDYVFDGAKNGLYDEVDLCNPLSAYGKSKEAGECAIREAFAASSTGHYAILRTSWVYGDGGNFIRTILRLAQERSELKVINDQYGVPTYAPWLAQISWDLVFGGTDEISQFQSGIYHAVPSGETSWFDLARWVVQQTVEHGIDVKVGVDAIEPIPAIQYPLPAPRPMNSRLSTAKLKGELERLNLVSKLPHWNVSWKQQVADYISRLVA